MSPMPEGRHKVVPQQDPNPPDGCMADFLFDRSPLLLHVTVAFMGA